MSGAAGSYLSRFLAPLAPFLTRTDITDIFINKPGEIWLETIGGEICSQAVPELDAPMLERLARQVAAYASQGISREHPLLSATLPGGERIQIVAPPATRGPMAFAIRKQVSSGIGLDDYVATGAFTTVATGSEADRGFGIPERGEDNGVGATQILRDAVRNRRNILISGGTSSGKTTLLNALLLEIPRDERLIFIEDTSELEIVHPNAVGLLAARSALSEARIDAEDLLNASLRMRPDRILLGEVRGPEAFTFLRAINTGHPGSMSTIHADSPRHAIDQLALLVLQSGARLGWDDVVRYVRSTVDIFVQIERRGGRRSITHIAHSADLAGGNERSVQAAAR